MNKIAIYSGLALVTALLAGCIGNPTLATLGSPLELPGNTEQPSTQEGVPTNGQIEFWGCASAPAGDEDTVIGVTQTADRFGNPNQACRFSGEGSFYRLNIDINPEKMPQVTLSAWARLTTEKEIPPGRYQVVSHDNGAFDRTMGLDTRGNDEPDTMGWSAFAGAGQVLGQGELKPGEWVQITTVYDVDVPSVKFYLNGQLVSESETTTGGGHDYIRIGSNPSFGEHFPGDIDDVRIYNRALSQAEVSTLYEKSKP